MQSAAALLLALSTLTSASAIPRQATTTWQISDFAGQSAPNGGMHYALSITDGSVSSACLALNDVISGECGQAGTPFEFGNTTCGNGNDESWSWSMTNTPSPLEGGAEGYSLKIAYRQADGSDLYGCRFLERNFSCDQTTDGFDYSVFNVPSNFTMTPSTNSECMYS